LFLENLTCFACFWFYSQCMDDFILF
jgi:hypothetical protein